MPNQLILYANVGKSIPNAPTHYPIDSKYNDATEFKNLKESHYVQNRISDAMTFSATITPVERWEILGEMKVRFDVEDNNFKRGFPTTEKPDGTLVIDKGVTQGYMYPGMNYQNSKWGSYTRGNAFNYYLSPNISSNYTYEWRIPLRLWRVSRWNYKKIRAAILIKMVFYLTIFIHLPVPMVYYMRGTIVHTGLRWVCMLN